MNKEKAVEIVLEKRFGEKNPAKIPALIEINTIESTDNSENNLGIGIELVLEDDNKNKLKEEYQVNKDGIIFSWGNTAVIDEKSLKHQF